MAKRVKIRTTEQSRFSSSIIYFGGITVKFNEEGIGKVERNKVKGLLEADSTLSIVTDKSESNEIESDDKIVQDKIDEIRKGLEEFTVASLQELAQEIDKPKKQWENLRKVELIDFILDNS